MTNVNDQCHGYDCILVFPDSAVRNVRLYRDKQFRCCYCHCIVDYCYHCCWSLFVIVVGCIVRSAAEILFRRLLCRRHRRWLLFLKSAVCFCLLLLGRTMNKGTSMKNNCEHLFC